MVAPLIAAAARVGAAGARAGAKRSTQQAARHTAARSSSLSRVPARTRRDVGAASSSPETLRRSRMVRRMTHQAIEHAQNATPEEDEGSVVGSTLRKLAAARATPLAWWASVGYVIQVPFAVLTSWEFNIDEMTLSSDGWTYLVIAGLAELCILAWAGVVYRSSGVRWTGDERVFWFAMMCLLSFVPHLMLIPYLLVWIPVVILKEH